MSAWRRCHRWQRQRVRETGEKAGYAQHDGLHVLPCAVLYVKEDGEGRLLPTSTQAETMQQTKADETVHTLDNTHNKKKSGSRRKCRVSASHPLHPLTHVIDSMKADIWAIIG